MQNPEEEITNIILRLTSSPSPDVQRRTVEQYMTSDVAFRHPICAVESGPNSRKTVLGIYQWYRVLSPHINLTVNSVVWDPQHNYVFLDIVQWFKLFFLPIGPAPARLCVRLTLRREESGLYYIAMQEDFYHPDGFLALLLPPLVPFIRIILVISGLASALYASFAQFLGFWRTNEVEPQQPRPDGPGEGDLYNNGGKDY
ncbi:hypothetical protein P691DRAFT_810225 [Macrolepiota fuliginosa MF-IS2]|uniref:SigF-like NTF2-like domain-containing protein n=1 Tax=Macrolepiota fuliginosa MF-IS2 TaxID=1400762 RepID=A0A9P5X313_9AGAR|nr:hypothetical protein P691DRAFT_810225 [Macrolepiota fuliginosa MF-IS2]